MIRRYLHWAPNLISVGVDLVKCSVFMRNDFKDFPQNSLGFLYMLSNFFHFVFTAVGNSVTSRQWSRFVAHFTQCVVTLQNLSWVNRRKRLLNDWTVIWSMVLVLIQTKRNRVTKKIVKVIMSSVKQMILLQWMSWVWQPANQVQHLLCAGQNENHLNKVISNHKYLNDIIFCGN